MPRDYKPSARKRRRNSRSKSSPRWSWLLGGLIAGILASYAVYLMATRTAGEKPDQVAHKTTAPAPKATPAKSAAANDLDAKEKEKARFDFYTLLPEMEVKISKDTLEAARGGNSRKTGSGGPYILQIGSFRSYGEADNLKA
ncbi:MAG: hypothetical protein IT488_08285, partial [Gammaproteobacteria bacterium]|nr:hypothetical protein [Gammaproteobacteria bacterium]